MTVTEQTLAARLLDLRREFDRSFAAPPAPAEAESDVLLAIRAGDSACAIRLREVSAVAKDRRIVALPTSTPHVLGLAGVRGTLVPVFDLARAIGAPLERHRPPVWLLLVDGGEVAFAFDAFDGYVRKAKSEIIKDESARAVWGQEAAEIDGTMRRIVSLRVLARELEMQNDAGVPAAEDDE